MSNFIQTKPSSMEISRLDLNKKESPPMRTSDTYEARYSPISALRFRSFAMASRSI